MKNSGFSLLEVTVAVAILVTALFGLINLFNSGVVSNQHFRHRVIAMKACEEVMEQLKMMDYSQLPAQNNLAFEVRIPELPNKNIGRIRVVDVSGGKGTLYEITVSAIHPGPTPPPFSVTLVTRRAK